MALETRFTKNRLIISLSALRAGKSEGISTRICFLSRSTRAFTPAITSSTTSPRAKGRPLELQLALFQSTYVKQIGTEEEGHTYREDNEGHQGGDAEVKGEVEGSGFGII